MELDAIPDLRARYRVLRGAQGLRQPRTVRAILKSEEEHVDWLETQLQLIEKVGIENYMQSQT